MSKQYLRSAYLSVYEDTGNAQTGLGHKKGLALDGLHFVFHVWGATTHTMKHAQLRIWNLSATHAVQVLKEFRWIEFSAGYQDNVNLVFRGQIARVTIGKENAVDSFVEIFAQDGDQGKNWAFSNTTLAAGWTDDDVYQQCMSDFSGYSLAQGYKPDFNQRTGIRANVMRGDTSSIMDRIAANQDCDWFIEDGKVNMLPKKEYLPGPIPVLRPDTGLIGVPSLTFNGVETTCLLNPSIHIGCAVKIDNSAITQMQQNFPQFGIDDLKAIAPKLSPTGTYKAYCVEHLGDSRGNEWYTRFIGVAVDATGPSKSPVYSSVPAGE